MSPGDVRTVSLGEALRIVREQEQELTRQRTLEQQRIYQRGYRERNRERIREQKRESYHRIKGRAGRVGE